MFLRNSSFQRLISIFTLFIISVLIIRCTSTDQDNSSKQEDHGESKVELAIVMGQLQTYAHKFALSVEAENQKLASFYLHEMEASTKTIIEEVPTYEEYEIARLTKLFLNPALESVEKALPNQDWEEIREHTIELVDSCNSCHNATNYGFIKIANGFDNNPFNQDFSTSD